MKKALLSFIVVFITCMNFYIPVMDVKSAAVHFVVFENEKNVTGKKESVTLTKSDFNQGVYICKKLNVDSPTVLTIVTEANDLYDTRTTIGKSIRFEKLIKKNVVTETIYNEYFESNVDGSNNKITKKYYLPKGKYYISLEVISPDCKKIQFSSTFKADIAKNHDINTLTYKVNMNGGMWGNYKTVSKNVKLIKNNPILLFDFGQLESQTIKRTGYTLNGFTLKRSDGKWLYYNEKKTDAPFGDKKYYKWMYPEDVTSEYKKIVFDYLYRNNYEEFILDSMDETLTFYANWKANKFTIKYHANGGAGKMSNTYATFGESNKLTSNTFKRSGYTFKGWYVKRESDNKWLYTNGTIKKWFTSGKQLKGYSKVVYKNKASLSKTTSVHGDKVHMYAKWRKS